MIVPLVLGFYVTVCIGVVFFNCWKVVSELLTKHWFERKKESYRLWFEREEQGYAALSPQEREELVQKLVRTLRTNRATLAFHAAMEELAEKDAAAIDECEELLAKIVRDLFPRYRARSDRKRAYYSYLVARFRVMQLAPSEALTAFLLEEVRGERSLYNMENALRAIYRSGQVTLVLESLEALDGAGELALHEKLLVDGLLTFPARDELIAALWERFPHYGAQMRELLLDYIRFASGAWGGEMLSLLRETDELETKIACLRYFGRYPDERFRAPLYRLAEESGAAEWELCAVCMTVLASYPGEETLSLLKRGLHSRNWYVRYNAALSLRALEIGAEQVQDVLTGDDRFAREMLQYRLGLGAETEKEAVPV